MAKAGLAKTESEQHECSVARGNTLVWDSNSWLWFVALNPHIDHQEPGMILDASLTMEAEIMNIAKLAFLNHFQPGQLAPYLLHPDLAMVIHVTVSSRLDYCNSRHGYP